MERVWIEGSSAVRSVPRDAVPTIDNPPFVGASRATFMEPEEMIIGVSDGAVTRAYSTWLLNRYEIVNDRIGGKPIVVTWCPLCYSGAVYLRLARGRELMFGNSGMLWRENLVLYDRQTESWWSQLAGRAIRGEMQGAYLDVYPATMMSWKQWVESHPETEILSKRTPSGVVGLRNESAAYQRSTRMGITGRTHVKLDEVGAKELVLGFELEGRHYSVVIAALKASPVVMSVAGRHPIVIVRLNDGTGAKVFHAAQRILTNGAVTDGRMTLVDRLSREEWDGLTGLPRQAPEFGPGLESLQEIPSRLSYWFAWKAFFPETVIIVH